MTTEGRNPAPFSDEVIALFRVLIPMNVAKELIVHDPFAGEGTKLGRLCDELGYVFTGSDMEAWRDHDHRVVVANSMDTDSYPALPFAVVTSPCLAHGQRVLRDDLMWVPVEEVEVGDRLVAFDEIGQGVTARGYAARRKWQLAEVTVSHPQDAECVTVYLSNGESVVCTPNHPWLADRYAGGGNQFFARGQWVQARDLIHRASQRPVRNPTGWWVYRQLDPWSVADSYEAGWLAGIIDGEGCLATGPRTSLKLQVAQSEGVVLELIQQRFKELGFDFGMYQKDERDRPVWSVCLRGGLPDTLRLLGHLRPARLLEKWASFDIWGHKTIEADKVQVLAVEPAGVQTIQALTTSTGTYIGEGYLHHNTYCNGVNDHWTPRESSKRLTYRIRAGHDLDFDNTGRWSGRGSGKAEAQYWRITEACIKHWGDIALVNVKDSERQGETYPLCDKYVALLEAQDYRVTRHEVRTPGWRVGTNAQARSDHEEVLVARRWRAAL